MNRECECRVLALLIFLIRFLEFTVDHKLHLSQNELFGAGPVVDKGVQLYHLFLLLLAM